LTDPILSRFDILSVIKDDVNEEADDALATFVINSHIKSHPEVQRDLKIGSDPEQMPENEEIERKEATKEWLGRNLLDDRRINS
jgi:DNA replication licensing factor MCM2